MRKISVINGPNLNLLGEREVQFYGKISLDEILAELKEKHKSTEFRFYQSNHEGALVEALHDARSWADGVIINAAAYSHSSIAIYDAILAIRIPCVEVHLSNVLARESFRHTSAIGAACIGQISGLGKHSYLLAAEYLINHLSK